MKKSLFTKFIAIYLTQGTFKLQMNNEASISNEYHYGTSSWTLFSLILFLIISITITEVVLKDIIVHVGTVTTFCHSWV